MDKRVGILHLSDIHTSLQSKTKIERLVEALKLDIDVLQDKHSVDIKLVCISGDLINCGDNAEVELNIALESFLTPLMNILKLDENSIFIVAGNHEIKQKSIVNFIESGLEKELTSEQKIEEFLCEINEESLKRISYFDNEFSTLFGNKLVWSNSLTRAYMLSVGELRIGISCVNSTWRSTGVGNTEKRKMIVGRKQIIDSLEKIHTADIKICMMHHPFDWLIDDDKIAVEKCINQFDIVLTGHIHESDTKMYTSFNGQTLFNTCGKFDNSSDIYNGYTLLSINPYNKECDVILRQYMDYPRNCFDEAIHLAKSGVFSISLGTKDDKLALAYNATHAIEAKFLDFAESYFVSNVAAGRAIKKFDESFIIPTLSKYSEYEKETMFDENMDVDDENISMESICNEKENILLLGKKEIGKTTMLHYITKYCISNFNTLKTFPIIINTLYADFSGKNPMLRASHKFLVEYCDNSESFSIDDVETLLLAGLCTVMLDNFETLGEGALQKVNDFLLKYPNNKFIFAEKEDVSARCMRDADVIPECEYTTVHICSLTKNQIRAIASQNVVKEDESSFVDKIMLCFKKTTLPKTPFVLSLIISLCDTPEFAPVNEAVVMEQFMEYLLEKSSPTEAYSTTFDFRVKEDFLIYLVSYMNEKNQFYLSSNEFDDILREYHCSKGFTIRETGFDKLFLNKGVLIQTELIVTFRYKCMIEYYLAKKAAQSQEFLEYILSDKNYLNYSDALLYYTGLNRRNMQIIDVLHGKLHYDFELMKEFLLKIEDYNIGLDIGIPEDTFSKTIGGSKLSQIQSDRVLDSRDISEDNLPENLDKQIAHEDMESFIGTLLIYGSCLKNLELITKEQKKIIYNDYISGLCVMLGIFIKATEEFFQEEILDMEKVPEKYSKEHIHEAKKSLQDIIKISLPIIIQNIAFENVGTVKLKSIIEEGIQKGNNNEFARFFNVFLFSDLRLPGLKKMLKDYVSNIDNKSLLTIIFFKLMYYYCLRYFSPVLDPFFENILADINIKLNKGNKQQKERIIQSIKDQKNDLK